MGLEIKYCIMLPRRKPLSSEFDELSQLLQLFPDIHIKIKKYRHVLTLSTYQSFTLSRNDNFTSNNCQRNPKILKAKTSSVD